MRLRASSQFLRLNCLSKRRKLFPCLRKDAEATAIATPRMKSASVPKAAAAEISPAKSLQIYVDGEFFDQANAKVSVFDHGLLYGDGIFEGIRFYAGRVFVWTSTWSGFGNRPAQSVSIFPFRGRKWTRHCSKPSGETICATVMCV